MEKFVHEIWMSVLPAIVKWSITQKRNKWWSLK